MSARIATRRLAVSPRRPLGPHTARRALSLNPFNRKPSADTPSAPAEPTDSGSDLSNPILEQFIKKKQEAQEAPQTRPVPETGSLPRSSLLHPDHLVPGVRPDMSEEERSRILAQNAKGEKALENQRRLGLAALKLDPKPASRQAWERRTVIKGIRNRGRLTKDLQLARTERQMLYKSPMLPTSVKKLTRVMNQIQGLTLEEAFVQLRFSKKKVARDVIKGLMKARDEAVVARGMGLGAAKVGEAIEEDVEEELEEEDDMDKGEHEAVEEEQKKKFELKSELTGREKAEEELLLLNGARTRPRAGQGTLIELKNGKTKRIDDPTDMYIDQAWVGKGDQWKSPEYRAKGRVNLLTHRTTTFSVVLKEEKTRMRISEEIKKKRANRKLWVALPDRPVTAQRQYCLW